MSFKPGDRVYVTDPALAELRAIMAKHYEPAMPNHYGTVSVDADTNDGTVLINFDDGGQAPYPEDQVRFLVEADEVSGRRRACSDGDCDLDNGHVGPHIAWVPE